MASSRKPPRQTPQHADELDRLQANLSLRQQVALSNEMYDLHRLSALNSTYYGNEVKRLTRFSYGYDILLAITATATAGGVVSHISVLSDASWSGKPTAALAIVSAVLSTIKPIITKHVAKSLDIYSKKYSEYIKLFSIYDGIVRELRVEMKITNKLRSAWPQHQQSFERLQKDVPSYLNTKKYNRLKSKILIKLPDAYYWKPQNIPEVLIRY